MAHREPIDHVGWDLHRASRAWKQDFVRRMAERGHAWAGEACGSLIEHIDRAGGPQATLVARSGMSKQAVQQHRDELERHGIVERVPDAKDARRKLVRLTARGREALTDVDAVKRAIEADYAAILGADGLARLIHALRHIAGGDGDG